MNGKNWVGFNLQVCCKCDFVFTDASGNNSKGWKINTEEDLPFIKCPNCGTENEIMKKQAKYRVVGPLKRN